MNVYKTVIEGIVSIGKYRFKVDGLRHSLCLVKIFRIAKNILGLAVHRAIFIQDRGDTLIYYEI